MFLILLTTYVLGTSQPYEFTVDHKTGKDLDFDEVCEKLEKDKTLITLRGIDIVKYLLIFFSILNLLIEFLQMRFYKIEYFKDFENMLQLTIYVLTFLTVIDVSPCARNTGLKTYWQWECASVCLFFSWLNLIIFLKMMPHLGIYIIMFTSVTFTFIRFFAIFFLFILAFGFTFFILLSNQTQFNTVGGSVLRAGTFNSKYDELTYETQVFYSVISYIMTLVFLVLMGIIVMNLLVGLAVQDIAMVQQEASIQKLKQEVLLTLRIEFMLPIDIQRLFNQIVSFEAPHGTEDDIDAHEPESQTKKVREKVKHLFQKLKGELIDEDEFVLNEKKTYNEEQITPAEEALESLKRKFEGLRNQQKKMKIALKNMTAYVDKLVESVEHAAEATPSGETASITQP
ncbi:hypothetical protein Ciccas_002504 [Cichlidogyrus casuarinus]|uniref:Ion transport domain-containing protein n=1 Tax=Cichlidogyrus casuarinus TaxID=1844966 RepID=A0ABD2QI27_9PLAT